MRAPIDCFYLGERHLKLADEARWHVPEGKVDAAPPRRLRLAKAILHAHDFELTATVEEGELADTVVNKAVARSTSTTRRTSPS